MLSRGPFGLPNSEPLIDMPEEVKYTALMRTEIGCNGRSNICLVASSTMRLFAILLVCSALCSCASHSTYDVTGNDPAWVSQDDSIRIAQDFLTKKGFLNTHCINADVAGKDGTFLFDTADPALRVLVHFDRKSKRTKIVQWIHMPQPNTY